MKEPPRTAEQFRKEWPNFKKWLEASGSTIGAPTNPYEVARFLTDGAVGVIYRDGGGRLTSWTGGSAEAWAAWKGGQPWRAAPKTKRNSSSRKRRSDYAALVQRDGSACVYCGELLIDDTATVDHIVPLTQQGPDNLANKALACESCNKACGCLSPVEKMRKFAR
jgi:hypothetical protein